MNIITVITHVIATMRIVASFRLLCKNTTGRIKTSVTIKYAKKPQRICSDRCGICIFNMRDTLYPQMPQITSITIRQSTQRKSCIMIPPKCRSVYSNDLLSHGLRQATQHVLLNQKIEMMSIISWAHILTTYNQHHESGRIFLRFISHPPHHPRCPMAPVNVMLPVEPHAFKLRGLSSPRLRKRLIRRSVIMDITSKILIRLRRKGRKKCIKIRCSLIGCQ